MSREHDIHAEIEQLLRCQEGEHCEFKAAQRQYSFDKLAKYCCALANEGGGKFVLGVSNARPRVIVGSQAFPQHEDTRRSLIEQLRLRIDVHEYLLPQGRLLIFDVPTHPVGVPIKFDDRYWARDGDSLVSMSDDKLRAILSEAGHDFSSEVCVGASLDHLDEEAIEDFRRRWMDKSRNQQLATLNKEQLLHDAELLVEDGVTYAALVLFGKQAALGRFLGQSEVVFEYRSSDVAGPAQERIEYRRGFFSFYDDLWQRISLRNDNQHYQLGLFVLDIPTFAERSVREALLNAVSHRNYQMAGNVFVRQYQRKLVFESPGGFPVGITTENILDRQSPRNRRIAEAFAKCGLVERSGQGMNLMFEQSVRQGKALPDFTGTDAYNVTLTLHGQVGDPRFVQFLEKVGQEQQKTFDTHDFLLLDLIHREQKVPEGLRPKARRLVDLGVIESIGRGRGTKYLLSKRFYADAGEKAVYTRRHGLDREESKAILLKHLRDYGQAGCPISELERVLTSKSREHIKGLLVELRKEGLVRMTGARRGAKWHPVTSGGFEGASPQ